MRRLIAALAVLPFLGALPAAAAAGEVVIVADGPGRAVLPADVAVDLSRVAFDTASPYVVVAAQRGTRVETWLTRFRDGGSFGSGGVLPAGMLSVFTTGRTTVRLPAPGLNGRLTIRATTPLAATFVTRSLTPDTAGRVEDDVAFDVATARSFVMQVADRTFTASAARATSFCVAPAGEACGLDEADPRPLLGRNGMFEIHPTYVVPGPAHALYRATEVAVGMTAVRHDVLVLPLA